MLVVLTIIFVGIGIILINKFYMLKNYKILNPLNIYVIVWMVTVTAHYFYFGEDEHTFITYLMILSSMLSLSTGFWILAKKKVYFKRGCTGPIKYNLVSLKSFLRFITVIDIIRIIISVATIYNLSKGNLSLLFTNGTYLRDLYLARETTPITAIISVFTTMNAVVGFVLVGLCNAIKLKNSRSYLILWTILELILCVVTMSKMVFFVYVAITATAYFNNVGGIKVQIKQLRRWIPIVVSMIAGLLIFIAYQRNYSIQQGLFATIAKKSLFYFVSPIEALNIHMSQYPSELGIAKNTFWIIAKIFIRLGIAGNIAITNHMEVVQTSMGTTNVYTWFLPFYQDLSYFGIVVYPFIAGLLAGGFYKNDHLNFASTAVNSFFSCLFAMSFFFFFWGQGSYVYAVFYALILNRLLKNKLYIREEQHKVECKKG